MLYPKKLTLSAIGCTADVVQSTALESGDIIEVAKFVGFIKDREDGVSTYGPWTKWKGEFEATNLLTGERARSTVMVLPSLADPFINSVFGEARSTDPKATATIGVVVMAEPRPEAKGTKFAYQIRPLVETSGKGDALTLLTEMLDQKQLEEPKVAKKAAKKAAK